MNAGIPMAEDFALTSDETSRPTPAPFTMLVVGDPDVTCVDGVCALPAPTENP